MLKKISLYVFLLALVLSGCSKRESKVIDETKPSVPAEVPLSSLKEEECPKCFWTLEDAVLKQDGYLLKLSDCEFFEEKHPEKFANIEKEIEVIEGEGLMSCVVGAYGKQTEMHYALKKECKNEILVEQLLFALGLINKEEREKVKSECIK